MWIRLSPESNVSSYGTGHELERGVIGREKRGFAFRES